MSCKSVFLFFAGLPESHLGVILETHGQVVGVRQYQASPPCRKWRSHSFSAMLSGTVLCLGPLSLLFAPPPLLFLLLPDWPPLWPPLPFPRPPRPPRPPPLFPRWDDMAATWEGWFCCEKAGSVSSKAAAPSVISAATETCLADM